MLLVKDMHRNRIIFLTLTLLLISLTGCFTGTVAPAVTDAPPPTPEWGTMLSGSRDLVTKAWWAVTMPGLPKVPSADSIRINAKGQIDGLF